MKRKNVRELILVLLLVSALDLAVLNLAIRATASGDDSPSSWPMFRHDVSHTGYSSSNVTADLVLLKNFSTSGQVRSSPAVVGDIVYVGSSDGYVYAWNTTPPYALKWKSEKFGSIESSPAVVDDAVYVGSDDGNIYALNATNNGVQIRNYTTTGAVKSSPSIVDGVLYAGSSNGYLYAFNVSTGIELRRYPASFPVESSPAVSSDAIFFGANGTNNGRVYAIEKSYGIIRWFYETKGNVSSSPTLADGMVFVGSSDCNVYALNATFSSLQEIWNYTTGGSVTSSPAIADDLGIVFVGSEDGYLYALNATSNPLNQESRLKWKASAGASICSSPSLSADGKVFVGSCDNRLYAFDVKTGNQIWNGTANGQVLSSPAIAKGRVFVGSDDNRLYLFGSNHAPVPMFTHYPETAIVTQQVTFDASQSYDPDNATGDFIKTYAWDFGDNLTAVSSSTVTHTYDVAGTYNVTLTVIDLHDASSTCWHLVNICEAWPMFRHDRVHAGYSTSCAPLKNDTLSPWPLRVGPDVSGDARMYPSLSSKTLFS